MRLDQHMSVEKKIERKMAAKIDDKKTRPDRPRFTQNKRKVRFPGAPSKQPVNKVIHF